MQFIHNSTFNHITFSFILHINHPFLAVTQDYETDVPKVYVIGGNSALLKCEIPSFVADFVSVESWTDNKHTEYFSGITKNYGNLQHT